MQGFRVDVYKVCSLEHGCHKSSVIVVKPCRYLKLNIGNTEFIISASISFSPITYFSPCLSQWPGICPTVQGRV